MRFSKSISPIKIFNYIYLAVFIFLFFYTFYRSEFIYEGKQISYYYKYYLIFSSGIIFWVVALFLDDKIKSRLLIVSTSVIFLMYFYEIIRFYAPNIRSTIKTSQIAEKTKFEVIEDLKNKKNEEVVPSVFPKLLLNKNNKNIFPLGGISKTITVFCKEGDDFSIYKSDRFGFNNPDSEWSSTDIKWYLIGDSFVHGSCVLPGEDFASRIRSLTKEKAISLGMSGNGPLIELASLKEYGSIKKPKNVLWFYFERNDLSDLKFEKRDPIIKEYIKSKHTQNLINRQFEIDNNLINFIDKSRHKKKDKKKSDSYLSFKKIVRLQIIRDKLALDRGLVFEIDPLFEKILLEANTIVKKWGGKLYFIYLPDKERYSSSNKDDSYLKRTKILELVKNTDIPIIDIHKDFFEKKDDPLSFYAHRTYGHYSPDGYLEIAKLILEKVKGNMNK